MGEGGGGQTTINVGFLRSSSVELERCAVSRYFNERPSSDVKECKFPSTIVLCFSR